MTHAWWRLQLIFWLWHYHYIEWWRPSYAWRWSADDCWQMYFSDNYTPRRAVLEDLSYG